MSKTEHFWNKENVLFHFESFFSFLRKSDYDFSDIQMSWRHQMPKHETRNTFYWVTQSGDEIWPVYVTLHEKKIFKKFYEKCGQEASSRPFLIFKEYPVKRNLRRSVYWFGQILIVLLIHI